MLLKNLKYVVALLVLASSSVASAGLLVPPGVLPGQQYRLAFVTSGTTNATSADIATYNNFVTAQAGLVPGLNETTWKAIGSTSTVSARDNTGTNPTNVNHTSVPIYSLNGSQIATGNADLWDFNILNTISVDQTLVTRTGFVWTGSFSNGTASGPFPLGSTNNFANAGQLGTLTVHQWVNWGGQSATQQNHMYALSGVITAVPEPSSLLLVGLVGLGTCGWSRRRKLNS
jgi:hypothetical protein